MIMHEGMQKANRPPTGSSSSSSSYLTRIKSEKVLQNHNTLSTVDEKIQAELLKEIELTKQLVEVYQGKFKKKKKEKCFSRLGTLRSMEEMISIRNLQIAHLNKQIKELKLAPLEATEETNKKYNPFDNPKLFKLAEEIKLQREQLMKFQFLHAKKMTSHNRRRQVLRELQRKYLQICQKEGEKPLTFEQFKEEKEAKKKEGQIKFKKSLRKVYQSIKDVVEQEPNRLFQYQGNLSLKEVLSKKQIAESALKVAKKKHINELNELNAKLDFLKDENELLEMKLREKEEQFKAADIRFSESRKKRMNKRFPIQSHD